MGAWGDVIKGAEARGIPGPQKQQAQYITITLREWMSQPGELECTLTVYGDTDLEIGQYDLTTIKMTAEGLRELAKSAIESAEQMEKWAGAIEPADAAKEDAA